MRRALLTARAAVKTLIVGAAGASAGTLTDPGWWAYFSRTNPASATTVLTEVTITKSVAITGIYIVTTSPENGFTGDITVRDVEGPFNVTAGAGTQTFGSLSLSVNVGDLIGLVYPSGSSPKPHLTETSGGVVIANSDSSAPTPGKVYSGSTNNAITGTLAVAGYA